MAPAYGGFPGAAGRGRLGMDMEGSAIVITSFDGALITRYVEERPGAETTLITGKACCAESIVAALSVKATRLACTWDGSSRSSAGAGTSPSPNG